MADYINPYHVIQGETKTWLLSVTKAVDGTVQDLTGCAVYLTLRDSWEDQGAPLIYKRTSNVGGAAGEVDVEDPLTGKATVTLLPDDTSILVPGKRYVMDVWVVNSAGDHRPVLREKLVTVGPRATRL